MIISQLNAQTPIHEFNFNGNLNCVTNKSKFYGVVSYITDREGKANRAINLKNNSLDAIINDLPLENSPRTVSIWVKFNNITTPNYIWGYGSPQNNGYYGLLQQGTTSQYASLNLASWGAGNDRIITTPISVNTWYNYTTTFDGFTSRIYRNGVLLDSYNNPNRNTLGSIFKIGKINSLISIDADVDDLKIYDVSLSEDQIMELYNTTPILLSNDSIYTNKPQKETSKAVKSL
jgi:hypothetical protein